MLRLAARIQRLAARIQRNHPVLVDQVLGTRDPAQIEAALRAMPLEIDRCFHFELSVGAVFGLELADGRRVAVKVHQPSLATEELEAQQAVQAHLAARGFPCPRPVLGPTPFLERLATAEGDSISIDYESVALGGAAATHTAAIHARVFRPSVETALRFRGRLRSRARLPGRRAQASRLGLCRLPLRACAGRVGHAPTARHRGTGSSARLCR